MVGGVVGIELAALVGLMASSDRFSITVHGRQTHGAAPWLGVDPIVTSAQVVLGLQTVVSRGVDISREPAVVTVGMIKNGVISSVRSTFRPTKERFKSKARQVPRASVKTTTLTKRTTVFSMICRKSGLLNGAP